MAQDSGRQAPTTGPAQPFIKWAGGKQRLLAQFQPYFPERFERYFEPFVGSGAVFFDLWNTRTDLTAFLSDSNKELVNCYRIVRDEPDALIALLAEHKRLHSQEHYYTVRDCFLSPDLTPVQRAARLIYLNKTCYNGLYRVNSQGQFNVPLGSYTSPAILEEGKLRAASHALQNAVLTTRDFRDCLALARAGDFFYFDPPYHPVSATANFANYTNAGFGAEQQRALADLFQALDRRGCILMLSNSWTPFILELYREYTIVEVRAARAINSRADRRGKIREVLVLNHPSYK